jgi:PAS domain S-box-containing protein
MKKNKTREGKNTGTHVDIAARKQAKAALQESEKCYRLLAENISDVIWTTDLDLKFTYVSPSSKLMAGYPPEEVMAMNLEQLLTSASLELAKKTLAEELSIEQQGEAPQRSLTLELENIGKDGSLIWTEAKVTLLRDSQGRPVGIQGVSRDISARKRSEEALRKSQESLARLNDCLLGFGNDSDKNIQRLVEVGGEILGADYALYSRLQDDKLFSLAQWQTPPDYRAVDLAEGRICFDVIRQRPAMPLVVRNLQGSHYAQSDTNVMRFKLQTYIGNAVHCQQVAVGAICVVYQADIDPNQNDLYLLNIIANAISVEEERKRAQEALQKAEKKYRSIFENAIEGIFQSTPGGIYISANTAMAKMFGYESPEDLMADISDIKKQVYVDPHQMVEFMRLGKGWVCQGFRISSLP